MIKSISKAGCLALASLLTVCLTGCVSKVPMPKGDSKGYASASFIAPNPAVGVDSKPVFVKANKMIQEAITAEMEKNGLKIVDANADLIIAHLIIFQDNTSTSYNNQYYGKQDFLDIVSMAHEEGMKKQYPVNVQKRALVIDLIDAKTFKLVYRHYSLSGSLANLSEEDERAHINTAVAETLQQFFK